MWQHNVYYVCVTLSVVRYVGQRFTFKNFKLSDFLKFNDFNEAPTNSLMMIY